MSYTPVHVPVHTQPDPVDITPELAITIQKCDQCGVLVNDTDLHDSWHEA